MVAKEQLRRRDQASRPGKLPRCLGPGRPGAGRGGCGRHLLGPGFCIADRQGAQGTWWAGPGHVHTVATVEVAGHVDDGCVIDSGTERHARCTPSTAVPRPEPVRPAGPPRQGRGPLGLDGAGLRSVWASPPASSSRRQGGLLARRESALRDLIAEAMSIFPVSWSEASRGPTRARGRGPHGRDSQRWGGARLRGLPHWYALPRRGTGTAPDAGHSGETSMADRVHRGQPRGLARGRAGLPPAGGSAGVAPAPPSTAAGSPGFEVTSLCPGLGQREAGSWAGRYGGCPVPGHVPPIRI